MKLFYMPGACSLAPHILLNETGLTYELEKFVKTDKTNIIKYNPKGLVPTIVLDDGKILTEAAVIMQYLADQKSDSNLIPKAGTWERYKCQEWLNYVSTELHKGIGVLFNSELDDNAKNVFKKAAGMKFAWLEQHFSKNQFLMGSNYSVADIYAFVAISWTKWVGIDLAPFKNLLGFLERVKSRPATMAALKKEESEK